MAIPLRDPVETSRHVVEKATQRFLRIHRDMSYAASEPDPSWSKRRQKVWLDAQLPTKDAPIYLKAAMEIASDVMRAERERHAPQLLGIVVGVAVASRDEWLKLASGETPALPPIDVEEKKDE